MTPTSYSLSDFSPEKSGLEQDIFDSLESLEWLADNGNIMIIGPSPSGKTHLARGLIKEAQESGMDIAFMELSRLLSVSRTIRDSGTDDEDLYNFSDILLIEDLTPHHPAIKNATEDEITDLIHYIVRVHQNTPIILTSSLPLDDWGRLKEIGGYLSKKAQGIELKYIEPEENIEDPQINKAVEPGLLSKEEITLQQSNSIQQWEEESTIDVYGSKITALDNGKIKVDGESLSLENMEKAMNVLTRAMISIVKGR